MFSLGVDRIDQIVYILFVSLLSPRSVFRDLGLLPNFQRESLISLRDFSRHELRSLFHWI